MKTLSILVLENPKQQRESLITFLYKNFYPQNFLTHSISEAKLALLENPIDLLLIDISILDFETNILEFSNYIHENFGIPIITVAN